VGGWMVDGGGGWVGKKLWQTKHLFRVKQRMRDGSEGDAANVAAAVQVQRCRCSARGCKTKYMHRHSRKMPTRMLPQAQCAGGTRGAQPHDADLAVVLRDAGGEAVGHGPRSGQHAVQHQRLEGGGGGGRRPRCTRALRRKHLPVPGTNVRNGGWCAGEVVVVVVVARAVQGCSRGVPGGGACERNRCGVECGGGVWWRRAAALGWATHHWHASGSAPSCSRHTATR
jgi:hypothetical protein